MTNQTEIQNMVQSWADFQKGMWDQWLESLSQGGHTSPNALWSEGLTRWKESVDKMLDYQSESLKTWATGLEDMDTGSPETRQWVEEGIAMMERWIDAERQLWEQWFAMAGGTPAAASGSNPMQAGVEQWRAFGEKMLEMQSSWADAWMQAAKPKK